MTQKEELIDNVIKGLEQFKPYLEITTWQSFELDFATDFEQRKEIIKSIKENTRGYVGIYAIFKGNDCLYIGIGRPIWKRIKAHYYASQGKDKAKRWAEFFGENKMKLTIFWKEFSVSDNKGTDDKIKQIIENILETYHKPRFVEKIKKGEELLG